MSVVPDKVASMRDESERKPFHESKLFKAFVFTAVPAVTAAAVATGTPIARYYHHTQAGSAYAVATTGTAGMPDHTDSGADFPLAAIPQPGTASIHINILGTSD